MDVQIIYKADNAWNQWEEQLDFEKSFVVAAILVLEDKRLIGQLIIYYNPFHKVQDKTCICIGNIELPDDPDLFAQMHLLTIEIAKKFHAKIVISPMDGSTWNNYRFVKHQSNSPFLLETTSKPYYLKQFKALAYEVLASYFSQETNLLSSNWVKCEARYNHFVEQGMRFDTFDIKNPEQEFRSLSAFCNKAFRKNFLFSPIEEDDFVQKMMQVIPIMNPDYTIISRLDGVVTGFVFAYQDLNNKQEKSLIVKTMARDIDKPYHGLGSILGALLMKTAIEDGFTHCIHALMIDHNASTSISSNFHGEMMSRYELLYYTI